MAASAALAMAATIGLVGPSGSSRTCTGYSYVFGTSSPRITSGSWIKYG